MMLVYVWVDGKGELTRRRLVMMMMMMMLRGGTWKMMGVVREMYRAERSVTELELTGKKMMGQLRKGEKEVAVVVREMALACVGRRGCWADLGLCCCLRHQPP